MKNEIDKFPKSLKKAIRYIKQDASKDELEDIKRVVEKAISKRKLMLD